VRPAARERREGPQRHEFLRDLPFHDFELFHGLTSRELSLVEGLLEMESFKAGACIIAQGSDPHYIYLLAKGAVSVYHHPEDGNSNPQKIAAFCPRVTFGDLALLEGVKRFADVRADEDATCYTLSAGNLRMLEEAFSPVYAKIITNTLRINIDRLRRCNREIASLQS
jgi:CRP-like cAMP-binding protein